MSAATTAPDDQATIDEATRIAELRERLIAFCEDGARTFVECRMGTATSCISGFIVSVTLDHVTFDVIGRNVTLQLVRVLECREHHRKPEVALIVKEPTT